MRSFLVSLARYTLIILSMTAWMAAQIGCANQTHEPSLSKYPEETPKKLNMNKDLIQLKFTAEPLQFSMSERAVFKISLAATNRGNEIIDPELHFVELFINDQKSMIWNETIGNGRREAKWDALPPGDTVSMSWSSMGESLFPSSGNYILIPYYAGKDLDPIHVHVLPK